MNAAGRLRRVAVATTACLFASCIASNVVAEKDRMVTQPLAELVFEPAPGLALDGLYQSIELTGDAALSLQRIWYVFSPDGSYTAAALGDVDGAPTFQTLNGTWAISADGLSLDGAAAVPVEKSGEHVRITAPTGRVVLRRERLQ